MPCSYQVKEIEVHGVRAGPIAPAVARCPMCRVARIRGSQHVSCPTHSARSQHVSWCVHQMQFKQGRHCAAPSQDDPCP